MSPAVRRSIIAVALLATAACNGALATEPRTVRVPSTAPHFDETDTTNRSGFTVPHG
jgi:hypothetical protein